MGNCSKRPNMSSITGTTVNKLSNNFIGLTTFSIIEHRLPAFIRSFLTSRISLPYSHHTEMFTAEYRIRQKKWWIRQIKQKEVGPSDFLLFICLSDCPIWNSYLVYSFYLLLLFLLFLIYFYLLSFIFPFFAFFYLSVLRNVILLFEKKNAIPHFISLSY